MAELWPDTVVEENTLARNISMLRKALGETPDERSYIVTIPGRGYCFVADVRSVSVEHEEQAVRTRSESELERTVSAPPEAEVRIPRPAVTDSDKRSVRPRNVMLALATLIILALGVGLGLSGLASKPSAAPFQTVVLKKLTGTGNAVDAAISPDGKFVAYVQTEAGKQSLWLRQTSADSDTSIVPPSEASYSSLIFSPDGLSLYFVMADGNEENTLYQLPVLGGVARKIIGRVNSAVTFSPDGGRLAFVRSYLEQQESVLMTANVDGTAEQRLAVRQNPDSLLSWRSGPAWSPDGRLIVAPELIKAGGMHCELFEVNVSDGKQRTITNQRWAYIGRLSWLPNGNGLIMTAADKEPANPQLWYLSWPDGGARRISQDLDKYYGLSMTADASALATVQFEEVTSIWATPLAGPGHGHAVQVTSSSNDTFAGLGWTPDGKIIYASNRSGTGGLWTAEMDGSQKLLFSEAANRSPAATPDGRYIVFSSNRNGQINIWRIDRDGRNPVQLTNGNYDYEPRCSPDGKWVVYMSRGGAPSFDLLRVSIDGGAPVRLAEKIVGLAGISPDGKWIAYHLQRNPWKLAVTPFEGGPPIRIFEDVGYSARWAPDGRAITWIKDSGGVSNIWRQPLEGGPPKQVTKFSADQITDFAWSCDGRQLAFRRHVTSSNAILVSNVR